MPETTDDDGVDELDADTELLGAGAALDELAATDELEATTELFVVDDELLLELFIDDDFFAELAVAFDDDDELELPFAAAALPHPARENSRNAPIIAKIAIFLTPLAIFWPPTS